MSSPTTGNTLPPATSFAEILGEIPRGSAQAPAPSTSYQPPSGSTSGSAPSSKPASLGPKPPPNKLQKKRSPTSDTAATANDHWYGRSSTQEPYSRAPSYAGFEECELQVSAGYQLDSTREDVAYDEKHFGNTYTAGWSRVRSTIRSTLSSILNPICPGRMKGYLDSALTATLGLPDITAAELNEAVHAERLRPNPERTRTALARAASTPTVIDEYLTRYNYYRLRDLEQFADKYPGKEGSAVRSRLRHSVATRMGRDPDWTPSVSVFDTLGTWNSFWVQNGQRFTKTDPSAANYIAYLREKADYLESRGRSEMVSEFMSPCNPARVEATRAQARLEDTQEWESLSFVMGVPMRMLGLARSIPSLASSWLSKSKEQGAKPIPM